MTDRTELISDFDTEDPIVQAALAADQELRDALHAHDADAAAELYAPEFTLNSPAMRIQTRQETLGFVSNREMNQVGVEREIEAAYRSGDDVVVVMGYESFIWEGTGTDLDGRPTARRFTNVWRLGGGSGRRGSLTRVEAGFGALLVVSAGWVWGGAPDRGGVLRRARVAAVAACRAWW